MLGRVGAGEEHDRVGDGRRRRGGPRRGACSTGGGAEAVFQLKMAARVGGGDDLGAGGEHVPDLAVLEARGGLRLGDGVDARAAAAPLGLGALAQLEPRDGAEDGAGLRADLLPVAEVATLVIGDGGGGVPLVGCHRRTLNVQR